MTAETILSNDKHNEFVASKDTDYFQNVAESILEYALEHPGVFKPEFDERFSEENFEENEEDFDNFRDPIIERIYSLDSLFTELSAVLNDPMFPNSPVNIQRNLIDLIDTLVEGDIYDEEQNESDEN